VTNAQESVRDKVRAIFRQLAGDRADQLEGPRPAPQARDAIVKAVEPDYPINVAADIAFHLSDWSADAAFIVALHLFPERFTVDDVKRGVVSFLLHAPNHVAAAAKLAGHPIEDVFGLGTLSEESN